MLGECWRSRLWDGHTDGSIVEIEPVKLFHLPMPELREIRDGSQDALVVRVRADGSESWGDGADAPLPSIAASCAQSHSACYRPCHAWRPH